MSKIQSITHRMILNSHVEFTTEFIIRLQDGSTGTGAAPKGETISIYEDRKITVSPTSIIREITDSSWIGQDMDQQTFDDRLQQRIPRIGRNNAYSLSLAFFNATHPARQWRVAEGAAEPHVPARLCLNILNGGWHAYTNPVLSDFSEFMLVARNNNIEEVICGHNEIQSRVREKLLSQTRTIVSGNPVHCFRKADNRECIEFLLKTRDDLGYADQFDLMIDASAGDLWTEEGYRLAITDGSILSPIDFHDYWMQIIKQYGLRFLEDPFREQDAESWQLLTAASQTCYIIGDNFYSSDAGRIEAGASRQYTHGAVIKPNQAGTVTAVRRAVEATLRTGQIAITSHRSISTEETFLSTLTCMYRVPYIKIGPLFTDYSSVIRLNEIIRLTEV